MKKKRSHTRLALLFILFLILLGVIVIRNCVYNQNDNTSNDDNTVNNETNDNQNNTQSTDHVPDNTGAANNEANNDLNKVPDSELYQKLSSGWVLVWNDEFNGDVINDKYWTLLNGGGIWGNNELQYYTDRTQNCRIEDGKLIIRGLKENYQNYQYTSARIVTKKKVDFLYGKIEIKAKFPSGKGLFPALWLLPCEDTYGDRDKNGEIDLLEIIGNDPKIIYGVVHYSIKGHVSSYNKYNDGVTDFSQEFHTYSIEWCPQEIQWMVDDKVYFSFNLKETFDETYNPFDKEFYLIMNLAIGGNWPGNDLSNTTLPSLVEIDYVRYYKLNS